MAPPKQKGASAIPDSKGNSAWPSDVKAWPLTLYNSFAYLSRPESFTLLQVRWFVGLLPLEVDWLAGSNARFHKKLLLISSFWWHQIQVPKVIYTPH